MKQVPPLDSRDWGKYVINLRHCCQTASDCLLLELTNLSRFFGKKIRKSTLQA